MDDILIFGCTKEEHDTQLEGVLKQLQATGATLNPGKCKFEKLNSNFLGILKNEKGIQPYPEKTEAIAKMPRLTCVQELKWFPHMILLNSLCHTTSNMLRAAHSSYKAMDSRTYCPV